MIASPDDARLLFDKWHQEQALVRVRMIRGAMLFDGDGVVLSFGKHAVQFGGESWRMTVPLAQVEYSFSDPREIPMKSVRDAEAAKYELGLSLRMLNGDEMILMELKIRVEE
jgi:hypothetical protein